MNTTLRHAPSRLRFACPPGTVVLCILFLFPCLSVSAQAIAARFIGSLALTFQAENIADGILEGKPMTPDTVANGVSLHAHYHPVAGIPFQDSTATSIIQIAVPHNAPKEHAKFLTKIVNIRNNAVVFEEVQSIDIGAGQNNAVTVSVKLKSPGFYRADYALHSADRKDTIRTSVLLAYIAGRHNAVAPVAPLVRNVVTLKAVGFDLDKVQVHGYLGKRLVANVEERLLKIDEQGILEGFYNRPGTQTWVGEYAGKYIHAATRAWCNTGSASLKIQMDRIVDVLLATQQHDGYLGTYVLKDRWTAWDVWTHKYNLLGLLSYYAATGYQPALEASTKIGDLLCHTFGNGAGQRNLIESGDHAGLASSSALEPMTDLYRYTGDEKYLAFCRYIIETYDYPGLNGPKIITTLNGGGGVQKVGNGKGYEMLSNFTGIVKLYQLTHDVALLSAMEKGWTDIVDNKLYITGTASKGEFFQDDHVLPAENSDHIGEGCVSASWLQFNQALFYLTAEAKYMDEIEKTVYNHLLAAENPVTGCVSYYTALQGKKPFRCTIFAHCCLSSVPRGIVAIPELSITKRSDEGFSVNLYSPADLLDTIKTMDGKHEPVRVAIASDFPRGGTTQLLLKTTQPAEFSIALRVPPGSKNFTAVVEGHVYKGAPCQYLTLKRKWKQTSAINITFELKTEFLDGSRSYPGFVAVKAGVQVLAFDQHLNPLIRDPDKIEIATTACLRPSPLLPENWFGEQAYSLEALYDGKKIALTLVPFADAGQTGGEVRVWMKQGDGLSLPKK